MSVLRVGHIGVSVSDLARARAFWCDLFGFRPLSSVEVRDPDSARLLRVPAIDQTTLFVERDGVRLALFEFREPPAARPAAARAMTDTGLAAVMLRVDDLEATLEEVRAAGFPVLEDTRVDHPDYGSKLVFVSDDDGTLVELIEIPGDPYAPFGRPEPPADP